MRGIGLLTLMQLAMPAAASDLTLERIFANPSLAGPTPRGVKVSPDGGRVALLRGRATDGHKLDLWTYDVKTGRLELRVDSTQLSPQEHLSDAERARRERERTADYRGIVDYAWAPDGRA
jgi:dipeptidyl-peptidase-4